MKALFIHGFNSDSNSTTGKYVRNILEDYGYDVLHPTFDLLDVNNTINKINNIITNERIVLIVGHSLGGFFTLASKSGPMKVYINPCFNPFKELMKLDANLSTEEIKNFENILGNTLRLIDSEDKALSYGLFAKNDELFSYEGFYEKYLGKNFSIIEGGHRPTQKELEDYLPLALFVLEKKTKALVNIDNALKESKLQEHFVNVFPQQHQNVDRYKNQVWQMLQDGYESIGGIAGCDSIDDLINDSDFWKLNFINGSLKAVCIYTFKRGGRKLMYATAELDPSTGKATEEGKKALYAIIQEDLNAPGPQGAKNRQFWAEVSGALEHIYLNKFKAPILDVNKVKSLLKDKTFEETFDDGHYTRQIGSSFHKKIGVGQGPNFL